MIENKLRNETDVRNVFFKFSFSMLKLEGGQKKPCLVDFPSPIYPF